MYTFTIVNIHFKYARNNKLGSKFNRTKSLDQISKISLRRHSYVLL